MNRRCDQPQVRLPTSPPSIMHSAAVSGPYAAWICTTSSLHTSAIAQGYQDDLMDHCNAFIRCKTYHDDLRIVANKRVSSLACHACCGAAGRDTNIIGQTLIAAASMSAPLTLGARRHSPCSSRRKARE